MVGVGLLTPHVAGERLMTTGHVAGARLLLTGYVAEINLMHLVWAWLVSVP